MLVVVLVTPPFVFTTEMIIFGFGLPALLPYCQFCGWTAVRVAALPYCQRAIYAPIRQAVLVYGQLYSWPYCLTALLPYCLTALLPYCLTALLPYCLTALLPYCLTALLPYCLLYGTAECRTAVLLYYRVYSVPVNWLAG